MKLFSKLYRLNLGVTIVIFLLSGLSFYFLLRYVVIEQFDETLQIERTEIERHILKNSNVPVITPVKDFVISFEKTAGYQPTIFAQELSYDTIGQDHADFRKIFFSAKAGPQWYRITVGKSMENTEHLIHSIIAISIVSILLILLISSLVNRILLKKLWMPFYTGLQLMKQYQVGKQQAIEFSTADIDEFAEMQQVLKIATDKADKDYLALKEFTENASHEMQTPLAVIRSKLDLMIQDAQVTNHHTTSLRAMYKSIQGLSDLNQSLLLLAKIGNNQYVEKRSVGIKDLITERIALFEDIFHENQTKLQTSLDADFQITMNADLAGILTNNLFSNAVKHNFRGGCVHIKTFEPRTLEISNSGSKAALDGNKIFKRFYKAIPDGGTTGLGLSIIRNICEVSDCKISYRFEKDTHSFLVEWL